MILVRVTSSNSQCSSTGAFGSAAPSRWIPADAQELAERAPPVKPRSGWGGRGAGGFPSKLRVKVLKYYMLGNDLVESGHQVGEPVVSHLGNRPVPVCTLAEQRVRPLLSRIHLEVGIHPGALGRGAEESQKRMRDCGEEKLSVTTPGIANVGRAESHPEAKSLASRKVSSIVKRFA